MKVAIALAGLCLIGTMLLLRRNAAPAPVPARPGVAPSPTPPASTVPPPPVPVDPSPPPPAPADPRGLAADLARALRDGDEKRVREIQKALHDLLYPSVPDADNAALLYQKAFDLARAKMGGFSLQELDREAYSAVITGKVLTAEQRARLHDWFEKNGAAADEVIAIFLDAGRKPQCRFPELDQQRITRLSYAINFLQVTAVVRHEAGRPDDAADIERAALALARATRTSPDITSQLLGAASEFLAVDTMQRTLDLSSPKLAAALDEADPTAVRNAYRRALLGDLERTVRSALSWRTDPASAPDDDLRRWARAPLAMQEIASYVEGIGDFLRLADRPYHDLRGDLEALVRQHGEFAPWYASLSQRMIPSLPSLTRVIAKSEAQMSMAKGAVELERHRARHGSYPATLDGIRIARDPFTGQPFAYRREGAGFILESPGPGAAKDALVWKSR